VSNGTAVSGASTRTERRRVITKPTAKATDAQAMSVCFTTTA